MRVLGPFLGALASIVTIFAAVVRLWWSKPRFKQGAKIYPDGVHPQDGVQILEPKAKPWLQQAARAWLYLVVFLITVAVVVVITTAVVRIIQISN